MINNIRFKIIAGKINQITEFYTIFARKMPDNIRQRDRGQAEAKILASRPPRPLWPRGGHFGLEDLTHKPNHPHHSPSLSTNESHILEAPSSNALPEALRRSMRKARLSYSSTQTTFCVMFSLVLPTRPTARNR